MATRAQTLIDNPLQTQVFPQLQGILFATDFSAESLAALPFAAAISQTFNSRIHLLHLLMPQTYQFVPPETIPAIAESIEQDALTRMLELRSSQALKGLKLGSAEVAKGELGELLRRIEERNIDLLVIGTHGRRGFQRLLLGSIAQEIVRRAPCPVLTVGPHAHFPKSGGFHPKHVVFATDATPDSFRAMPYAVLFAKRECSDMAMVHVLPDGDEQTPEAEAFAALMRESLHHTIPLDAIKSCSPEILVHFGDPVTEILNAAHERESELIVMGARSRSVKFEKIFSKEVSYGVIAGASCPVLTVRGRDL
jgi:nucleotide-binding universal stress UspA family protein